MNYPIRYAAILLAGICVAGAMAAMEPCKPYVSHTALGNIVNFTCGSGSLGTHHVRLRFCRTDMVEVSFSVRGAIEDSSLNNFDLLLKTNWAPVNVEVTDMNVYIMARTADLVVRAFKNPFRIEFDKTDITTRIAGDMSEPDANGVYGMASDGNYYILRMSRFPDEHVFGWGDNFDDGYHWGSEPYTFDRTGKVIISRYWFHSSIGMVAPFFYSTAGYGLFVNSGPSRSNDTALVRFDMGKSSPSEHRITFRHPPNQGKNFMTYCYIGGPGLPKVMDGYTEGVGVPAPNENGKPSILVKWAYGAQYGATQWRTVGELEGHVKRMRAGNFPYDVEIGDNLVCWEKNADGWCFFPDGGPSYDTATNKNPTDLVKWLDSNGIKFGMNMDIGNRDAKPCNAEFPTQSILAKAQYYVDHGFDVMWADNSSTRDPSQQRETFKAWRQAYGGDASKVFMIHGWGSWAGHAFPTMWPGDTYGTTKTDLSASMAGFSHPSHDASRNYRAVALSAQCRFHESYFGGVWAYTAGAESEAAYKRWINFRYRLIPYLFTCGGIAHETGAPIMRHMIWEDPRNPTAWDKADGTPYQQYYLGDWLLAAPPDGQTAVSVWFPKGTWYDWFSGTRHEYNTTLANIDCGDQATGTVPLYARAGAIIPLMPEMQWVGQIPEDPLTLRIWPSGSSSFTLFEDETPVKTTFRCDQSGGRTVVTIPAFAGSKYSPAGRKYILDVYTAGEKPLGVTCSNPSATLAEAGSLQELNAAASGWYFESANGGRCHIKPAGNGAAGFTVTVDFNDTYPPTIVSASALGDSTHVTVVYSKPVQRASAEQTANYAISGGLTVTGAALSFDEKMVTLTVSPALTQGVTYTLTVNNVCDRAGTRTIAANSQKTFSYLPYVHGVRYTVYAEGSSADLATYDSRTPVDSGITTGFSLGVTSRTDNFSLKFIGMIDIKTAGSYTFFTTSDDGSCLYIDGTRVVNNDGTHAAQEASGAIALTTGMHQIAVTYFEAGGGEELAVRWQGPGITKQVIPTDVLYCAQSGNLPVSIDYRANMPRSFALRTDRASGSAVMLHYVVPTSAPTRVVIALYDLRGRCIRTLVDRTVMAGYYETPIDVRAFGTGHYACRMRAGAFEKTVSLYAW